MRPEMAAQQDDPAARRRGFPEMLGSADVEPAQDLGVRQAVERVVAGQEPGDVAGQRGPVANGVDGEPGATGAGQRLREGSTTGRPGRMDEAAEGVEDRRASCRVEMPKLGEQQRRRRGFSSSVEGA